MPKYIFHLGYPKTGTTYLQRKIFPQAGNDYAVVTPEFENCGVIIQKIKMQIQKGKVSKNTYNKLRARPLLFSIEGLLFDPMRLFSEPLEVRPSFKQALQSLRELTGDVTEQEVALVLYLRSQDELAHSLYAESKTYVFDHVSGMNSLEGYASALMAHSSRPEDPGYYYNYTNTLDEIRKVFPNSQIYVRFYESLSKTPKREISFWSNLLGLPVKHIEGRENSRSTSSSQKRADPYSLHVRVVRWKNRLIPSFKLPNRLKFRVRDYLRRFNKEESLPVSMPDQVRRDIREHFIDSNKCLFQRSEVKVPAELANNYLSIENAPKEQSNK